MPATPKAFDIVKAEAAARMPNEDARLVLLYIALSRIGRMIERDRLDILRYDLVEPIDHSVMVSLWLRGPDDPPTPGELSDTVVQSPSGMTKTLRRLEDAELIYRTPDPKSARSQRIYLTAAGEMMVKRQFQARFDQWRPLLEECQTNSSSTLAESIWSLFANGWTRDESVSKGRQAKSSRHSTRAADPADAELVLDR